jgi:hypothetical protein
MRVLRVLGVTLWWAASITMVLAPLGLLVYWTATGEWLVAKPSGLPWIAGIGIAGTAIATAVALVEVVQNETDDWEVKP